MATFDLRDPGAYTLQVMVAAFFGDAEPLSEPLPITVGSHTIEYNLCNVARALVDRARCVGCQGRVDDGCAYWLRVVCRQCDVWARGAPYVCWCAACLVSS